jgi:hypothetical protein
MDFFDFLWRHSRRNFLVLAAVAVAAAIAWLFGITSELGLGLLMVIAVSVIFWMELRRDRDQSRMSYAERYGDGWLRRSIDRIKATTIRSDGQPPSPR